MCVDCRLLPNTILVLRKWFVRIQVIQRNVLSIWLRSDKQGGAASHPKISHGGTGAHGIALPGFTLSNPFDRQRRKKKKKNSLQEGSGNRHALSLAWQKNKSKNIPPTRSLTGFGWRNFMRQAPLQLRRNSHIGNCGVATVRSIKEGKVGMDMRRK